MDERPRDVVSGTLRRIVDDYGDEVLRDPRRCRALLMDLCGNHRREINLIEIALRENVVKDLNASSGDLPQGLLFARLTRRLQESHYLPAEAADWAVRACAAAASETMAERGERSFASEVPVAVLVRDWLDGEDAWRTLGTTPGEVLTPEDVEVQLSGRVGDADLMALAEDIEAFGGVERLDLSYSPITGKGVEALRGTPGLLGLNLAWTGVGDGALEAVADLPQLIELDLWGCREITDAGVLALSEMVQLERLDLGLCEISDVGLRRLLGLNRLQDLSLSGTQISDRGLETLGSVSTLQRLDLSGTRVTGSGLESIAGLPALAVLNMSGCVMLTSGGLSGVRLARHLTHLDLSSCGMLGDEALSALRGLRELTDLSLAGVALSDAALLYLRDLALLSRVDLSWTGIGDAGVARLRALRRLRELSLSGTRVSDASLLFLADLPELRYLDLSNTRVTDTGLRALTAASSLEVLDLEGTDVKDAGLVHLGELPKLQRLYLGSTSVTDVGLDLIGRVTDVQAVDLTMCEGISAAGVSALGDYGVEVVW